MKKTILALSATCALCVLPVTAFAATSTQVQTQKPATTAVTLMAPYPGHLIELGSHGVYVKEIQQRLNQLGDNVGVVDGIFGSKTLAAVKAFQKSHGLTVDGIVGSKTWNSLFSAGKPVHSTTKGFHHPDHWSENTVLKQGNSGVETKNLQYILNVMSFYTTTKIVDVDGVFGPKTMQAVEAYQKGNGLSPDGVVGPRTWASFARHIERVNASTYGAGSHMGLRIEWKFDNTSDTSSSTAYVYGDGEQLSSSYRLTAQ